MPILSSVPVLVEATLLNDLEKNNCCPVPCKHVKPLKVDESCNIPTIDQPSSDQKKSTSLVSRTEGDFWVDISNKRLRTSRLGALYDGSRFKGVQKCGTSKYNVLVDIQVIWAIVWKGVYTNLYILAC